MWGGPSGFNGANKGWADARQLCQQKGGDLVVYETYEEQSFVSIAYCCLSVWLSGWQAV